MDPAITGEQPALISYARTGIASNGDPSPKPPQSTVTERAQGPIPALLDRGIRQTDYRDPSLRSPPGVHFDLNLEGIHSDDRCRINLRWHNSVRKCSFIKTFARNVLVLGCFREIVQRSAKINWHAPRKISHPGARESAKRAQIEAWGAPHRIRSKARGALKVRSEVPALQKKKLSSPAEKLPL